MLINLENFRQPDDWTCPGFLLGQSILPETFLSSLDQFDWSSCLQLGDPINPLKRRGISCHHNSRDPNEVVLLNTVRELVDELNTYETLAAFITKSFQNAGHFSLTRFWANGLDTIKRVHGGMSVHLCEDYEGFSLSPHVDHREAIAWMQIYLEPETCESGTMFHESNNWDITRQVPFVRNNGYFVVNTCRAVHSITHKLDIKRKSIIFVWCL